jgi:hypothetical protein
VQPSPFALSPHVPSAQTPDWQSLGRAHGSPSGFAPHVPSAHGPPMHCASFAHAWPTGSPHVLS